jgi:hypothetical protein
MLICFYSIECRHNLIFYDDEKEEEEVTDKSHKKSKWKFSPLTGCLLLSIVNAKFGRLWVRRKVELAILIERGSDQVMIADMKFSFNYSLLNLAFFHELNKTAKNELFVLIKMIWCGNGREIKRFIVAISGKV